MHGVSTRVVADRGIERGKERASYTFYDGNGPILRGGVAATLTLIDQAAPDGQGLYELNDVARAFMDLQAREPLSSDRNRVRAGNLIAFDRIVDPKPFDTLPTENRLLDLAQKMRGGSEADQNVIPAAYSYLGQIVAHDLAETAWHSLHPNKLNLRTHALDFDTIFGPVPHDLQPFGDTRPLGGLCIGQTTDPNCFRDLPRGSTGQPVIADERNDHNLLLAQMHVEMSRFHHAVFHLCQPKTLSHHRSITRRHLQSIVLQDYAPRLVDTEIIDDVAANGRAVVYPAGSIGPFRIPVEFSVGVFRMGHSMIRQSYKFNESLGSFQTLEKILANTYYGGSISETEWPLRNLWTVDWTLLTEAHPHSSALAIDESIVDQMFEIDRSLIDHVPDALPDGPVSLAALTLLRGRTLGIPSAQELLSAGSFGVRDVGIVKLTADEVSDVADDDLKNVLEASENGFSLAEQTPLWFYILREASQRPASCEGRLGGLGGRVLYETLHAAAQAAEDSIVTESGAIDFAPHPSLSFDGVPHFTLQKMIAAVRGQYGDH